MRIPVFIFLVLFTATGCSSNSTNLKPENDKLPPESFAQFLSLRFPSTFPTNLLGSQTAPDAEQHGRQEIEAAFDSGGISAVQALAFRNSFLLETGFTNNALALYKITHRDGVILFLSPVLVPYPLPPNGFSSLVKVDGRFYVVTSNVGSGFISIDQRKKSELLAEIESKPWPLALDYVGGFVASALADTKIRSECPQVNSNGINLVTSGILSNLAEALNNENIAEQSLMTLARRAVEVQLTSKEVQSCPYLLFRLWGSGISPVSLFDGNRPKAAIRLAFMGGVAMQCLTESEVVLKELPRCIWDYVEGIDKKEAMVLWSSLGEDSKAWDMVSRMIVSTSTQIDIQDVGAYCIQALSLGFQTGGCFQKLGLTSSPRNQSLSADITLEYFREGQLVRESRSGTFPIEPTQDAPIITAAVITHLYDNCKVPVFWREKWWRVCPRAN